LEVGDAEFWIGFRNLHKEMGKIATLGLASAVFGPLMIFQDLFLASVWQKKEDHRIPNSSKDSLFNRLFFLQLHQNGKYPLSHLIHKGKQL